MSAKGYATTLTVSESIFAVTFAFREALLVTLYVARTALNTEIFSAIET